MGGSFNGNLSNYDLTTLETKVKQRLHGASDDVSRHIFISFDHEDENEINLLRGQAKNDRTDLQFDDYSVKDPYDSTNADYIKRKIREKIEHCSVTIVYLTDKSASSKWVDWEINESLKQGKGVIGVYKGDTPPTKTPALFQRYGFKVIKWEHAVLMDAIEEASIER
jgi:hypothetical protein